MNVGELEDVLARLPADMIVCVSGHGYGAFHIDTIDKSNKHHTIVGPSGVRIHCRAGQVDEQLATFSDARYELIPGRVILRGGSYLGGDTHGALWCDAEVPVTLTGRWPAVRRDAKPPRRFGAPRPPA